MLVSLPEARPGWSQRTEQGHEGVTILAENLLVDVARMVLRPSELVEAEPLGRWKIAPAARATGSVRPGYHMGQQLGGWRAVLQSMAEIADVKHATTAGTLQGC
jgi:hypothetical protein